MKTKHTKGEWMLNNMFASEEFKANEPTSILTDKREVICLLGEVNEKEANAKLIAAAPELLECVIDALSDLGHLMSDGMKNHFEIIIKKATE